jgi:hypothetical protein
LKKDQLTSELVFFLSRGYEKDIFKELPPGFELKRVLIFLVVVLSK